MPPEESEQIALDHQQANLSETDQALLDFALRLGRQPAKFGREDIEGLRRHAFTDRQILEAVMIVAITNFINTLNTGLGVAPDFKSDFLVALENAHPLSASDHLMEGAGGFQKEAGEDPDATLVARVQDGDVGAFEDLVRRHGHRIQRTLAGILEQPEDAEDAMQDAFVSAFQHISQFRGQSKFSTWLTRIAINTGLQRLRARRVTESFDDTREVEEFHPRHAQAWSDNPEELYSKAEIRALVEESLMKLPPKYRAVILLRDIQQFSTEEAAAALGLGIPALKARLLRGRLMLREALAPHFARSVARGTRV